VDAALSGNFDLVLMDCQMPGLDGLSATRKIREQQGKERIGDERASWPIPIVGLTAHASGSDRNRCLEAGMDAYCGKPFEPAQLLATIDLLLSPPSSAADDAVGSENRRHSDKPASAPAAPPAPADRPTIPPESSKPIHIDGLIQRCSGNRTLAATILRKFEKQSAELFAELRRHADASDAAELARVSHALKGSAGIVAAGDVARWAAELERAGRGGDLGGVTADLERLQQAIARCIDYCGREATRLQAESADREPEGTHATAHRG
jgi:CheY-like chemotaxis protein